MVGTTAAIAIALAGASTAANVYSAHKKSEASQQAAQAQVQASNNALAFNQNQWQQLMQMHSPYIQQGQQAVNLLGGLMTPGGIPRAQPPVQPPVQSVGGVGGVPGVPGTGGGGLLPRPLPMVTQRPGLMSPGMSY